MRLRSSTVLAFVLMLAALPVSGAAYRESDNGLLGTMEREARGRVGMTRLANCLSMVMEASGIAPNELRRLRKGREIRIDERIFDPSFHPSASVVRDSKRILDLDSGKADGEALRALKEEFAEFRKEAKEKEKELAEKLEAQKENAILAAANAKTIQDGLTAERDAAISRANKAEAEVGAYKKSIFRELFRRAFGRPEAAMVLWFFIGILVAIVFHFIWRKLYLEPKNFIRPIEVRVRAEDGTRHLFTWNEDRGGYDCEECQSSAASGPDGAREQGRGLKLENLKTHLDRKHAKFRIMTPKRDDTTAA